jgi:hypothetical protein
MCPFLSFLIIPSVNLPHTKPDDWEERDGDMRIILKCFMETEYSDVNWTQKDEDYVQFSAVVVVTSYHWITLTKICLGFKLFIY